MATFRKRGNKWYAEVFVDGVRKGKSHPSKAEARAWASGMETLILDDQHQITGNGSFSDACNRYAETVSPTKKGERWEKVRLKALGRDLLLSDMDIATIENRHIAKWRDLRLKDVSPGTVLREMNLMRSMFQVAIRDWGWLKRNPMDGVIRPPAPKHRDRRVNDDEVEQIIHSLGYVDGMAIETKSQQIAIAFLFALETAMRVGEILSLTWDRVFVDQRYVRLVDTKNGDTREVPLSRRAVELLNILRTIDDVSCFTVTTASADALFRKARRRAGIEDLHFHDTRHEALTRLANKLSVLELARMVGHRDPRSLMIYYNATATELASLLD